MSKISIKSIISKLKGEKSNNIDYIITDGCPKVNIDDKELAITLGQWMGCLPDSLKSTKGDVSIITSMTPQELLKRKRITEDDYDLINSKFGKILKLAGFGEGNNCVLNNFNDDDLSFNCSFSGSGDVANMRVRFGSWLDEGPTLIINFDEIKTVYNYWTYSDERPANLEVQYIEKKLDNQGRKFYRYMSPYSYYADVYDDNYRLYVQIEYPDKNNENKDKNLYINEETMESLLSQITFPADLENICQKVSNGLNVDPKSLPTISIKVKKMVEKNNDVVIDEVLYKNGMLTKLIITKYGKTITLSNFEQWSYKTEDYDISQMNNKSVSYGFTNMPIDKLETMLSPKEMVNVASQEVENVRTLAKTLFNQKKEK